MRASSPRPSRRLTRGSFRCRRNDDLAGFSAVQRACFAVKAQSTLRLLAAVASDAILLKDGSDVAREGDAGVRLRRAACGCAAIRAAPAASAARTKQKTPASIKGWILLRPSCEGSLIERGFMPEDLCFDLRAGKSVEAVALITRLKYNASWAGTQPNQWGISPCIDFTINLLFEALPFPPSS